MPSLSSSIVNQQVASVRDVEEALSRQSLYGGDLITNLLELAAVSEERLSQVLAESFELEPAPPGELPTSAEYVRRLVPGEVAQRFALYPLAERDGTLTLAVAEPLPTETEQDLSFSLGAKVVQKVALLVRVRQAIARDYGSPLDRRSLRVLARLGGKPDPSPTLMPSTPEVAPSRRPPETRQPNPEPPSPPPSKASPIAEVRVPRAPAVPDFSSLAQPAQPGRQRRLGPVTAAMAERSLLEAKSRDDVLRVFFDFSSQYFDYSALFAVQGDLAEGRDASGAGAARARIVAVGVPLDLPSAMSRARDSSTYELTRLSSVGLDGALAKDLERRPGHLVLFLPVQVRGRTVLILYGDHGDRDVELSAVAAVISFAPLVAKAFERLILHKRQREKGAALELPKQPLARPREPSAAVPNAGERAAKLAALIDERFDARGRNASSPPTSVRSSSPKGSPLSAAPPAPTRSPLPPAPPASKRSPLPSAPPASKRSPLPPAPQAQTRSPLPPAPPASKRSPLPSASPASKRSPLPPAPPVSRRSPLPPVLGSNAKTPPTPHYTPAPTVAIPVISIGPASPRAPADSAPPASRQPSVPRARGDEDARWNAESAPSPFSQVERGTRPGGVGRDKPVSAPPPAAAEVPALEPAAEPAARAPELLPRLQLVPEAVPPPLPADAPDIDLSESATEDFDDVEEFSPISSGVPLAPASRSIAYSARPLPMRDVSQGVRLPTVIVDLASDTQALVERLLDGDASASEKLAQIGDTAITVLASIFPGPLTAELRRGTTDGPGKASECGPVLRTLARMGTRPVPFVAVRTADGDPVVRAWATRLLGEMPSAESAQAVVRRLTDDDPEVRRAALAAGQMLLHHLEAAEALQAKIAETVSDATRPEESRYTLIEALAELRAPLVIPTLIRLLEDGSPDIVRSAHWALGVIARQDFGTRAALWEEWWLAHSKRHRIEWLIDALLHENQEIRRTAGDELKALTKEYFGYYDDLPKKERERAQERYRQWWETKGKARFR